MKVKRRLRSGQASAWTRLLGLALCFLAGAGLGRAVLTAVPDAVGGELTEYLRRFLTLEGTPSGNTLLSALVLYLRYPLLAALLGFASIGVVLLPLTTAAFGFSLSFSVCCLTASFGAEGVLLALAVFGLRCLISLPCYFLLAERAWEMSLALALSGRGRRKPPVRYGRDWWLRLGLCTAALLAGICLEMVCSPWILRLVLGHVLA